MATYAPEDLKQYLGRVKQRKLELRESDPTNVLAAQKSYKDVQNFNEFGPKVLDTKMLDTQVWDSLQDSALVGDNEATSTEIIKARNQRNYELYQQALRDRQQANKNAVALQPLNTPGAPSGPINNGGLDRAPGTSYYTKTPSFLDINAGMKTFNVGGRSYTVNASVANRFQGFLTELVGMGYKIKSHGSYANRNQANGSGRRSLHSYGLAIDLNPFGHGNSYNPGGGGKHYTNMPKGVSALAAKYGLVWGGDWRKSKDYMHFSIPYNGLL